MKTKLRWPVTIGLLLIALSALVYYIHFLIFRDPHHIFLYFFGDLGFVFFEVLLVALVLHRLLHHRKERAVQQKLHMLVGAFFSEMGTELLGALAEFDENASALEEHLAAPEEWSEAGFLDSRRIAERHASAMDRRPGDVGDLARFLARHKPLLLDLIQNPALLRDEPFTNLVWAVFHLAKELEHLPDPAALSKSDRTHLGEDLRRVYTLLVVQWMDHMRHLQTAYPYLFSLADRTNPFRRVSPVEVK